MVRKEAILITLTSLMTFSFSLTMEEEVADIKEKLIFSEAVHQNCFKKCEAESDLLTSQINLASLFFKAPQAQERFQIQQAYAQLARRHCYNVCTLQRDMRDKAQLNQLKKLNSTFKSEKND